MHAIAANNFEYIYVIRDYFTNENLQCHTGSEFSSHNSNFIFIVI